MSLQSRINQLMKKALEKEQPVGEFDFSRMSDAELARIAGKDITKQIASMSTDELRKIVNESGSIAQTMLN